MLNSWCLRLLKNWLLESNELGLPLLIKLNINCILKKFNKIEQGTVLQDFWPACFLSFKLTWTTEQRVKLFSVPRYEYNWRKKQRSKISWHCPFKGPVFWVENIWGKWLLERSYILDQAKHLAVYSFSLMMRCFK